MNDKLNSYYNYLLGKNIVEAKQLVPPSLTVRISIRDGKPIPVIGDYKENRINVEIKDSKIINITGIG